jgi:hypothetical protein
VTAPFFVVAHPSWFASGRNERRLRDQRVPLGNNLPGLDDRCRLFVKFRSGQTGRIVVDTKQATLQNGSDESWVASSVLARELLGSPIDGGYAALFFDGSRALARCILVRIPDDTFAALEERDPAVRLAVHDLPPTGATVVDSPDLVRGLLSFCTESDSELFSPQANRFLNGPHILEQLLTHLMEIRAVDAPSFFTITKALADQFRGLLAIPESPVKIMRVHHSHIEAWASVEGSRIAFVDGGAARLSALPGVEPAAMRVGVYSVVPGSQASAGRERFVMDSRLIVEITDGVVNPEGNTDRRRLQEAVRYVLELLVALRQTEASAETSMVFVHGPLVNQFVVYDDQSPNYLPGLDVGFLGGFGITESAVSADVPDIPHDSEGKVLWSQFMATYGYLLEQVKRSPVPLVGVVERSAGHPITSVLLRVLEHNHIVQEAYVREVEGLLSRFQLTDSFLFGCLLDKGEYLTPVLLSKNQARRAHPEWQPVVRRYMSPFATVLKTNEAMPPFRVEMNPAGMAQVAEVMRLTYHTARLLPDYAFPVGLDIVDKYAKVPDWLSKGVSVSMAAAVMRHAMREGNPALIAQARHFLAGEPRDFFYRPSA